MALDLLQYKIEVDASQAKAEAASTEQALQETTQAAEQLGTVSTKTERELRLLAGELSVARVEAKQLTDTEKAAIDACRQLGDSVTETSKKTGIAAETIRVYTQQIKESNNQTSTFLDTVKRWATGAVVLSAIKASADWADRLGELSLQTGIGVVALQKFDNAAKMNGANLEALTSGFGIFQDRLAGGDKSVIRAVSAVGLKLDDLKRLSPEEQMRALADAVTAVVDPSLKAEAATDLFGKTGRALIPTLAEISQHYDQLPAATAESVKQTGNLSDQFVRAKDAVLRFITEAFSPLAEALGIVEGAFNSLVNSRGYTFISQFLPSTRELILPQLAGLLDSFKLVFGSVEQPALKAATGFDRLIASAKAASEQGLPDVVRLAQHGGDVLAYAELETQRLNQQLRNQQQQAREAAKSHGDLVVELEKSQVALGKLNASQIASIESGLDLHLNVEAIAKSAHTTTDVVKLYESSLKNLTTSQHTYNEEARKTAEFQREVDMSLKASIDQMHAFNAAQLKEAEAGAKRFDELIGKEFYQMVSSNKTADDTIRQMTMSSLAYQIDSIQRAAAEKKAMYADDSGLAAKARDAIDREAAAAIEALKRQHDPLRQLFADIRSQIVDLGHSVNDNFAAMVLGAESFKDGFSNIWNSLKQTAINILSDILAYYEKVFLVRLLMGAAAGAGVTQAIASAALSSVGGGGGAGGGGGGGGNGLVNTGIGLATTGAGGSISAATLGTAASYAAAPVAGGIVGFEVGKATGSKLKGAAAGAATGAGVGVFFGGAGAIVGAGVGALMGLYGAHRANEDARNSMVDVRNQLKETFGSLDAVRQAAQAVGVDIDKAFQQIGRGVDGVDEFNKVVQEFQTKYTALDGALKHYGVTLDQVKEMSKSAQDQMTDAAKTVTDYYTALTGAGASPDAAIKLMAGDLNALLAQAIETGTKLPATLEPYLDQLTQMGLVTDANRDKLLGLSTDNTVDMKAMTDVAQRYGLSLESLGDKFNAAKLTSDARQVAADFKVLQDGGADIGAVLEGMKPKFQDLVTASMKLGTELPADLEDPIAYLIKMGMLTDQNGDKLTDLGQLKFGQPMADQFKPVTDAIHDLIDVLTGKSSHSLPGALQDGIDQMGEIAARSDIRVPVKYTYETINPPAAAPAAHGGLVTDTGVQYLAHGGMARLLAFRPRGTDTVPAMLTPGEGVINRRGMAALSQINSGNVGGDTITIQKGAIVIQGADDPEAVAEAMMRRLAAKKKFSRRAT